MIRGRQPVGKFRQPIATAPASDAMPWHESVPGGGPTLGRAINANLQQSTMARGIEVSYTTGHSLGTYHGGGMRSPQQFVKLTTQGSPQDPVQIAQDAYRIRLARRTLSRNRGLAPGV